MLDRFQLVVLSISGGFLYSLENMVISWSMTVRGEGG